MDDGTVNDFSRGDHSPQAHVHDSTGKAAAFVALALSAAAFGAVIAACILMPEIIEARSNESVSVALRPISAQVASAQDRAWLAERNSKMTDENLRLMQTQLSDRGTKVRLNHE